MTFCNFLEIFLFIVLLVLLTPVLGGYMSMVFSDDKHFLKPVFGFLERMTYRFIGVNPREGSNWKIYAANLLWFNFIGLAFLFFIQIFQSFLPFNPQHLPDVSWHSSFNTAVSFVTNTNWQGYAGETALSGFVQMIGLTVQNFVSAATGIAVLLVLIRGFSRHTTHEAGNFWADVTRTIVYILLPLSILFAVVLAGQGVVQNFSANETAETLAGKQQIIPMGPVASQIAIKQLGTNGGGFFNANSAHPFENPTPFSGFIELLLILLIPVSLTYTYGKMIGSARQGWTIFAAMMILFLAGLCIALHYELEPNALANPQMEGKEMRFGVSNSVLWAVATTAASNGSVNAMHDSLSPLAGMVALVNIMLGEIIFGGAGAGLYGIIVFVILAVFIAGLMIGRTPEYLGKKIEAFEVQMAILAILAPSFVILIFTAWACMSDLGLSSLNNAGPHGFTEILYAYSSAAGNNGSAFAGLNANTVFYNVTLGIGMFMGRFGVILPLLALAGNMSPKKITPPSAGTFRTDNFFFVILLIAVILVVGGLTFFPALSLGPMAEHLMKP